MLPTSFWGRWLLTAVLAMLFGIFANTVIYFVIYRFVRLPPAGWLLLGAVVGSLWWIALQLALADWIVHGL